MSNNNVGIVVQVFSSPDDLKVTTTNIKCSEQGCDKVLPNSSSLEMHLIKRHHKQSCYLSKKAENVNYQFFCPQSGCKYSYKNDRKPSTQCKWFPKAKYLKQHYQSCHSEKVICTVCSRKFTSKLTLKRHLPDCGKSFNCVECNVTYNNRLSYYGHYKRKHLEGVDILRLTKSAKKEENICKKFINPKKNGKIFPKLSENDLTNVNIAAAALSELSRKIMVKGVDKAVQTVNRRKSQVLRQTRCSTWSQTANKRISAETQTTARNKGRSTTQRNRAKSTETQTFNSTTTIATESNRLTQQQPSQPLSIPSNQLPELMLTDSDLTLKFWNRNNFGTQTNYSGDEIESVLVELLRAEAEQKQQQTSNQLRLIQQNVIFDPNQTCNTETQTEFEFNTDNFITLENNETQTAHNLLSDDYSNNCTQTNDDIFLNEFVEFTDIETQTGWANLGLDFVNTETQTII